MMTAHVPIERGREVLWLVFCLTFSVSSLRAGDPPASRTPQSFPGADLFTDGAVHPIDIEIPQEGLVSLRQSPRHYIRATVRADKQVYPAVAVHLKGSTGSFRSVDDKPSLTLDFARFDPTNRFHRLRRIHLNNSVEDPSCLNEVLGSELFRAAGVPAPRVTHARVRLNGRALGLYVLKEGFTDDFLGLYFRRTDGNLYDNDWHHDVDQPMNRNSGGGSRGGREDLRTLAEAAREPVAGHRWERLEQVLDVDRFLTFMAMEVMLCHRDGYCLARNNFRIYHDPDSDRLVFLPQGMDQLFGKADFPWNPCMAGLVAAAIKETPAGQRQYADRFTTLYRSLFKLEALTNRVTQLLRALQPSLSGRELADLRREATVVNDRMVRRWIDLQGQLSEPELRPLEFKVGIARLSGWVKMDEPVGGTMDRIKSTDGVPALHIVAGPETFASWRTKVLLRNGRYRFEGRGRTAGVRPLLFDHHQGAGLRVSGRSRSANGLVGDSSWQPLSLEFKVDAVKEVVELICELRAHSGEVWLDLDSLRLVRTGSETEASVHGSS
jgi:spore coat protein H